MLEPRAAARKALAEYLAAEFQKIGSYPDLQINDTWPAPHDPLPKQSISLNSPPDSLRAEYHVPMVWGVTPDASGAKGKVRFSYGRVEVDIQLDIWAQFFDTCEQISNELWNLLNRPAPETLGTSVNGDFQLKAPGLLLTLTEFFDATADYLFDPISNPVQSPGKAMVGEWRATMQGTATFYLMSEAHVTLMKSILIKLGVNGATPQTIVTLP